MDWSVGIHHSESLMRIYSFMNIFDIKIMLYFSHKSIKIMLNIFHIKNNWINQLDLLIDPIISPPWDPNTDFLMNDPHVYEFPCEYFWLRKNDRGNLSDRDFLDHEYFWHKIFRPLYGFPHEYFQHKNI